MKNKTLLIIPILAITLSVKAQHRVDRPIQIQLNGSGIFLKSLANVLADSEVDNLEVNKWGIPGISFGYHLNKRFYFGYAFHPNRNFVLSEQWTFGEDDKDGNIIVDHNSGSFHSLEGRYFPFKFDLYGSLFLTHTTKGNYNMDFNRISNTMVIGENLYATDINADWNFISFSTVGIGFGYNYVHKSGFSFDLGIGIPIVLTAPVQENINIKSKQGVSIMQEDIESGIAQIENELFYFPIQLHINIGYNFMRKTEK